MPDKDAFMDVKGRISPDEHRLLCAIASATDKSVNEIVCDLVHTFVQAEVRRHNLIASVLRANGSAETTRVLTGHSQ